ncbi:cytochrome c oxidase subunit II [Georgenia sp. H159]|uniref:aa3-type cytochrome oxidase subunit II n=1 Tax=Georgenia sp. H159 TaxID=3076115 RepID=UPI002D77FE7D|nr:cytochrome c oxidase subunit II [Georgenia sp. H159]
MAALTLAGCAELGAPSNGFLPSQPGLTDKTGSIIDHWNGAWVAALAVGVLVWGLIIWCVIAYRKRKNDSSLPVQLRYHIPLELMYTVVPILMIGVLYFYSVQVTDELTDVTAEPDLTIEAYGKQWSWDFNYLDDEVYFEGGRIELTGEGGVEETLPTLYLPVGETVEFVLETRDVNHAFWIPAFLMKMDMIAGKTNSFQVTPQEIGSFQGKCAELCGEFHSEMLFNVEVVDRETYDAEMDALREAGNVGRLGEEYNRVYDQRGYLQDGTGNN